MEDAALCEKYAGEYLDLVTSAVRDERLLHGTDQVTRPTSSRSIDLEADQQRDRPRCGPRRGNQATGSSPRSSTCARSSTASLCLIPGFGQLIEQVGVARHAHVPGRETAWVRMNDRVALPGEADGRSDRARDRRRHAVERARRPPRRQPRRPPGTGRVRASTSPCGSPAGCSPSATCTPRWATARSASPASRSPGRSTSASTCSKGKQATWPVTELEHAVGAARDGGRLRRGVEALAPRSRPSCSSTSGASRPEDAFIFLSVACDAGVAQACKPAPGFGFDRALRRPEAGQRRRRPSPRPARGTGPRKAK